VNHSLSRGGNLSVLLSLAAALVISSVLYSGICVYGQQSDSLGNPIPLVNNNTSQQQASGGKQQLVIIPSLSSNELSTVIDEPEPNEEIRRLEQGLVPQRTGMDSIEENSEKVEDELDTISATESENIQKEEENQIDDIQKQQEDTQEKLAEKLEAAESKTSKTIEETIRESENIHNEQNDDTNEKEDKETGKNNGVPIELPFP
jgi:3-methyladenine DNA glycosylase AlkC